MLTARNPEQRVIMDKIRANLYAINSYYAYQDFKRANPNGRRYTKKGEPLPYNPYQLSPLTQEARERYALAQSVTWSDDKEDTIKAYVLRLRLNGTLDTILAWEKDSPGRYQKNPWRAVEAPVSAIAQGGNAL